MAASASSPTNNQYSLPSRPADGNSNCKTLGFALAIIVGILGVAALGVSAAAFGGLKGWWYAGALGHLPTLPIALMAAGGGVGVVVLVIVLICRKPGQQKPDTKESQQPPIRPLNDVEKLFLTGVNYRELLDFGPTGYRHIGMTVFDMLTPPPPFDMEQDDPFFKRPFKENYVLIYIPSHVKNNNVLMTLNLANLQRVRNFVPRIKPIGQIAPELLSPQVDITHPGWKLISKKAIPVGCTLEGTNFRAPYALEAMVLHELMQQQTQTLLFRKENGVKCAGKIHGLEIVVNDDFGLNAQLSSAAPTQPGAVLELN